MPRFYFHCHDRLGATRDDTGADLPDRDAAYRYGLDSVRSIVADDVKRGYLAVEGRLDIADQDGAVLFSIAYADAFYEVGSTKRNETQPPIRAIEAHGAMAPRRRSVHGFGRPLLS